MNGCRPPDDLVLVHGWGMTPAVWEDLLQRLGPQVRVQVPALPGHAGAPFDPGLNTLTAWAEHLLAAAPQRAVWVGWSLGALVALRAALGPDGPSRIAALVLLCGTPRFVQAADWPAAMPAQTLAAFRGSLQRQAADTLARFAALVVQGGADPRGNLRRLRAVISAAGHDPAALATGLDLLANTDLRADLAALAVPTRWLFGGGDALVPAAVADAVGTLLPAARRLVMPAAAHVPMLSHPVETAAFIRAAP